MSFAAWTWLLLAGPLASAQPPPGMPGLPPGLSFPAPLSGAGGSPAVFRYVVAETPSQRFPDATTAGPVFAVGTQVVVLVEEADRMRVMKGDQFGWLPISALAADPPPGLPTGLPAIPGLPPLGAPPAGP